MDITEAIEKMNEISRGDQESAHVFADNVLLDYLRYNAPELAEAWERVNNDCGGFWYA